MQSWELVKRGLATGPMSPLSLISSRARKESRLLAPVCVSTFICLGSRLWKELQDWLHNLLGPVQNGNVQI